MAISSKSAQEFVPIKEIQSGTVIMKDGSFRGVILCTSINFALKSDEERAGVLSQFQEFLNSLDFSIQILVQSRRLDIRPYTKLVASREKEQVNDLMRIQVREYMAFIEGLTEQINIMTKNFFVVVTYEKAQMGSKGKGFLSFGKKRSKEQKDISFEESKSQLDERISFVMQGLSRTGVRTERLNTEQLIELYYKTFNPGDTQNPAQQQE